MKRPLLMVIALLFAVPCDAHGANKGPSRLSPALCEMLGMADEYISRFDYYNGKPRALLVEHFYPAERKLAEHYKGLIAALNKGGKTRFKAQLRTDRHGHHSIRSKKLARLINSYYVKVQGNIATLDASIMLAASRSCRLRYIQGAYRRYHQGNSNVIMMANAGYKIETIGKVLISLGARQVALLSTRTIPVGHYVFFAPGAQLAIALPIKKRIKKGAFAKRSHQQSYRELKR